MNIKKLIEAAQAIDLACEVQEKHVQDLKELAARARRERRSLTHEIAEQPAVFEIGNLIRDLRKALKAKP